MKQQTAVEWLIEQLKFTDKEAYAELYENIEQAKQMEKKQIKETFAIGWVNALMNTIDGRNEFNNAEQYYKETFGKE